MYLERKILIENKNINLKINNLTLKKALIIVDKFLYHKIPKGEIYLLFLKIKSIISIHKKFFNNSLLTDVMTFEGFPEMNFAGEILISPDKAKKEHKKNKVSFSYEIMLYIVHGWLHLAGYNDKNHNERIQIREMEFIIMKKIIELESLPEFKFLSRI